MKNSWAQPSLSRDFALLSAAILFFLFIISAWVTYTTYNKHTDRITTELEKESSRIERTLGSEMERANYLLTALGKHIILDPNRDMVKLAQILKSFDSKDYIYSIFSWVSVDQKVVVSSNKGVLEKPVDISDRDYVKKAFADPWKMTIGRPIEGRVSGRWVIPVAMGITDYTGKFIGTIQISLDINSLTEQISSLVRRDGISFAIVSKTLIPLTQVSDDKDFVNHNFPTQKLVNVNFSKSPNGLVAQGSLFWGTGSYAYYRVSDDYPYIILLGYDTHYSDETVRSLLWSRLLQMVVMAVFFVLFLWIVRVRMIKPVMDMTAIVAEVAKGEPYTPLPQGGPIEIESLAGQIKRVCEYIDENKRIENELRNKMHMLKKAKERAELDKRNRTEFLAWICQEMHTPLNNIIGFGQVMKDQLYGPIENRKYRQYAADIYATGNEMLEHVQDLLTFAKTETDYIELTEKPLDIATVISRTLRFLSDKMQAEKLGIKVQLGDPLPRLIADEFRIQQILMNLLLYTLGHILPESTIMLEAKAVSENKDKQFFAFVISNDAQPLTQAELMFLADQLMFSSGGQYNPESYIKREPIDLSLELAKMLVTLHNGYIDVRHPAEGVLTITVLFGPGRIRFVDNS